MRTVIIWRNSAYSFLWFYLLKHLQLNKLTLKRAYEILPSFYCVKKLFMCFIWLTSPWFDTAFGSGIAVYAVFCASALELSDTTWEYARTHSLVLRPLKPIPRENPNSAHTVALYAAFALVHTFHSIISTCNNSHCNADYSYLNCINMYR